MEVADGLAARDGVRDVVRPGTGGISSTVLLKRSTRFFSDDCLIRAPVDTTVGAREAFSPESLLDSSPATVCHWWWRGEGLLVFR